MELVGTVKLQSKLKKNSEGIFQLQLMYICDFSKTLLLFIPPALAFLRSENESSDLYSFVFYVNKDCDSPSIAMITRDTVWNNRSLKVFLLPHHKSPVPRGQFNDTTVRVPNNNFLCNRHGCNCLKQHAQKIDKKYILHILVEEKEEGGETILNSVFAKDDKAKSERDFTISHLRKSQIHFLTEFNERRINVVGDLQMLSNMVDLSLLYLI